MEVFTPPGLNDFRAHRPYRDYGFHEPSARPGFRCAGLTCFAITVVKAFAIYGGGSPALALIFSLYQFPVMLIRADTVCCVSR
jgi:hypothetical protein